MPVFSPAFFNTVILYGEEAIEHFDSLVQYWKQVLTPAAWDEYLFISVSTNGSVPALTQPPAHLKGFSLKVDPEDEQTWQLPSSILNTLQAALLEHPVMVHLICGDFNNPTMPPQTPVHLIRSINNRLGVGHASCAMFMMLHEHAKAVEAQRGLVQAVAASALSIYPYLLTRVGSNGALYSDAMLWRAVMCEVLILSSGRRYLTPGNVNTLGYTSLNANDNELKVLRTQAICDTIAARCDRAVTLENAWSLLTACPPAWRGKTAAPFTASPSGFSSIATENALRSWLMSLADQYVLRLESRDCMNLRILQRISKPEDAERLFPAVKALYEINRNTTGIRPAREHVQQYARQVKTSLQHMINAAKFPADLMQSFLDALKKIARQDLPPLRRPAHQKKGLLQSAETYLTQCFKEAEAAVRDFELQYFVMGLAKLILQELKPLEQFLATARQTSPGVHDEMVRLMDELSGGLIVGNLQNKYPAYVFQLQNQLTMSGDKLFEEIWSRFTEQHNLLTEDGRMDPAALRSLIALCEEKLHHSLGAGLDGGFIPALTTMLNNNVAMQSFLDDYLQLNSCLLHFIDEDKTMVDRIRLADTAMEGAVEADYFIDNDNVERIDLYRCQHPLSWFVSDDVIALQNRYLGQVPQAQGGRDPVLISQPWQHEQTPVATVQTAPVMLTEDEQTNPRHVALNNHNGHFMLSWVWEDGMNTAIVYMNDSPSFIPHDVSKGSLDVTSQVIYGRNDIKIYRGNGSLYAQYSALGKQTNVSYRFVPDHHGRKMLKMLGYLRGSDTLFLQCIRGDKPFFYPILGGDSMEPMCLKGLELSGVLQIVTAPDDAYPRLRPETDPRL